MSKTHSFGREFRVLRQGTALTVLSTYNRYQALIDVLAGCLAGHLVMLGKLLRPVKILAILRSFGIYRPWKCARGWTGWWVHHTLVKWPQSTGILLTLVTANHHQPARRRLRERPERCRA